ncbi:hypothetical protein GCM10027160_51540 [Streptomyces calidiresistens]
MILSFPGRNVITGLTQGDSLFGIEGWKRVNTPKKSKTPKRPKGAKGARAKGSIQPCRGRCRTRAGPAPDP